MQPFHRTHKAYCNTSLTPKMSPFTNDPHPSIFVFRQRLTVYHWLASNSREPPACLPSARINGVCTQDSQTGYSNAPHYFEMGSFHSPGWRRTCYGDQANLELMEICRHGPGLLCICNPVYWDYKHAPPAWLYFFC